MDIVLWIVACTLACMGISMAVGDMMFVRRSRRLKSNYRLIALYDNPVQVEQVLNQWLLRLAWNGPDGDILLVDMGMGEEALAVCNRARGELYGSFFCRASELSDKLRELETLHQRREQL